MRAALERGDIEVVAYNDPFVDPEVSASHDDGWCCILYLPIPPYMLLEPNPFPNFVMYTVRRLHASL